MIICPNCGAKNRIPGGIAAKQKYRCGKCGAMLPAAGGIIKSEDGRGGIPRPLEMAAQDGARISKPVSSYFSLTAVSSWFKVRENQLIFSLVLLALVLHLSAVSYVRVPTFDENYYVPEARSIILQRAVLNPEHPALGKLFIVSGILSLGDNPWGWRIPSVLFGVASLMIFYLICRRLAKSWVALLATFLLVFETLNFVMSGLAMLDVFSLTFMLLAFLFYLNDRYVPAGLSLALSALCKLTGVLGIFVIAAHWLIRKRKQPRRNIALFVLALVVAFMVLLPASDFLATGHWMSPIAGISQMIHISGTRTFAKAAADAAAHPGTYLPASYPWTWILSPKGPTFPGAPHFHLIINPTIWILIIPSIGFMLYEFIRRKTEVSLFVLLWFAVTYLLWIPAVLLTNRVTYVYYFYPTVGAVCIGVSLGINRIWDFASKIRSVLHRNLIKAAVIGYLALNVLTFLALTPTLQH